MLDGRADWNDRNDSVELALKLVKFGAADKVSMLLDAGSDGSIKDDDGKTAWDYAQANEKLKDTDAYWMLNDARFK